MIEFVGGLVELGCGLLELFGVLLEVGDGLAEVAGVGGVGGVAVTWSCGGSGS